MVLTKALRKSDQPGCYEVTKYPFYKLAHEIFFECIILLKFIKHNRHKLSRHIMSYKGILIGKTKIVFHIFFTRVIVTNTQRFLGHEFFFNVA
jgi:hypothetical protein